MTPIDVEDMALLEDEVSQLRSENEYLKLTIDSFLEAGRNHRAALEAAWDSGWWAAADASGVDLPAPYNPYNAET